MQFSKNCKEIKELSSEELGKIGDDMDGRETLLESPFAKKIHEYFIKAGSSVDLMRYTTSSAGKYLEIKYTNVVSAVSQEGTSLADFTY